MKEIFFQKIDNLTARALSPEDAEVWANYKDYQITRHCVYGVKHPRSVRQINTYFGSCRQVAENHDDHQWSTKEKVDFNTRVHLHFIDPEYTTVRVFEIDGVKLRVPVYRYRSISFKNLGHIEACGFFSGAFEYHAEILGFEGGISRGITPVDQLMAAIAERCGGNR
jgi:hypothetical protein